MTYEPRLTIPENGHPAYTRKAYGGYNSQIDGNPQPWTGSVLANCTGYVHGRWIEIAGHTADDFGISNGNANTYYNHADGYTRSQTPKPGAIICYGGEYGHVGIVEEVYSDNSILVSQSNYGGIVFETLRLYPPAYAQVPVTFQGFILNPYAIVEPDYTVNVVNGSPSSYKGKAGSRFAITANLKDNEVFTHWVITGAGAVDNVYSPVTTATVGSGNGTITAVYKSRFKSIYYISPLILRKR